jgi:hypothetical protein
LIAGVTPVFDSLTVNTRCHVASISNPLPLEPQQLSASVAIRAPLPEFATT